MGSIVYLDYGNDNWNYSITNYCTSSFCFCDWLFNIFLAFKANVGTGSISKGNF